jgi:hypothetical protein
MRTRPWPRLVPFFFLLVFLPNWGGIRLGFGGFFFLESEIVASVQGVPYPTAEAVPAAAPVVSEGKGKGKGGGVSPEKGSSGAPSGDDASRRYDFLFLLRFFSVPVFFFMVSFGA